MLLVRLVLASRARAVTPCLFASRLVSVFGFGFDAPLALSSQVKSDGGALKLRVARLPAAGSGIAFLPPSTTGAAVTSLATDDSGDGRSSGGAK